MKRLLAVIRVIITLSLLLVLIGFFLEKEKPIQEFITGFFDFRKSDRLVKNKYYTDHSFQFVQNATTFLPKSYQEILNIYYTVLNSGMSSFTFYCPYEYQNCIYDIKSLANDQEVLSAINNYVHPYNSFHHIETEYDTLGRVTIEATKSYTEAEISQIEQEVDRLYPLLVKENRSVRENIRSIHDYIIEKTKYDSLRNDQNRIQYHSDIAYGPLFEGYAICGGYTDLMELFLNKMGINNYKVSSDNHIWNAVEIDNQWYHLDLTWDDPVAGDGTDYLEHTYFLIPTSELLNNDLSQHSFQMKYYPELDK